MKYPVLDSVDTKRFVAYELTSLGSVLEYDVEIVIFDEFISI